MGIIVEQAMSLANGTDEIKYPTIKESHDIQTSPSSEKSRGALAEESRKAFYMEMFESLYPSYFDARNFLNAPTVVLHISIDTFRRWGSVLGVVQSLVEELVSIAANSLVISKPSGLTSDLLESGRHSTSLPRYSARNHLHFGYRYRVCRKDL